MADPQDQPDQGADPSESLPPKPAKAAKKAPVR